MPPSNSSVFSLGLLTPCCSHLKSVVSVEADISRLAGSGLAMPLNITALELENTVLFLLYDFLGRLSELALFCGEKVWFHLAWKELILQRKVLADKV